MSDLEASTSLVTYDPNIRWATHCFEFTFQQWDYTATAEAEIRGNCRGFDLMEDALLRLSDQLYATQGENPTMILRRPAEDGDGEDTLECSPDGEDIEDWLKSMCVAVRLVAHVAKALEPCV